MRFSLEHAQDVLSGMPDPTFILSEDGLYIDVFGGIDRNAYHDGSSLIGETLHSVLEKEQADWFIKQINRCLTEDSIITIEYKMSADNVQGIDPTTGPNGLLYYEGKVCPLGITYQGRRVVLILTRNISNRHQVETILRHQSQIDALTNIYNRRVFFEKVSEEITKCEAQSYQAALLFFDLDFFKSINDERGHDAGDYVLETLAELVSSLLTKDETFSRVGGEEFAIILPDVSLSSATEIGEEIRSNIEKNQFEFEDVQIPVTVSVGVVNIIGYESTKRLYARADKALYAAKRNGRNCVITTESES
ncbi:sensor domain-containing diguanylate cyclase [Vibrio natriegens]|uniref:diguanylate cyclase n=1 Tax=Vibrio natriegens NBRC 15636 = ATCC 14048 = DSM 759 TaxID=1219067 RepID=A0AAN0Y492_VIBNA|nr:sensor domain-containing diguanylate cyclase [Vibrio natriegens]ALR14814.1 diguanylate cyclase [Vibrio natriegens NBRC 15636 = ATCC 14048 = DSM 759]ANQ13323.1 diguanylate cyclase [Vibrio natriegens NBRC 15636 = ATCC 14048 = DSM 759]ANQ17820.1 diguanylate cyclase [Vibrio natriegens]EPM40908.1 diguanylate cyclase [Vibrio natriegens NBRC 15636 = ATCC 14048 = DSM 759]MDX6027756.1 diguanylate cyclase [Vibrio natriegens NBRC 15636 = ATCC 14048 = DSM 759]